MTVSRDSAVGRGHLAREGTSEQVWLSAHAARAIIAPPARRASTPGSPGQIVFSNLGGYDPITTVRKPGEAGAFVTGVLILVFTRLSGALAVVAGVSAIGVTHNDDTAGTVSPMKQGDATIFSAFTASFGAPVDTINIDTAAITAVKGSVFPLSVRCYAYGSNSTPTNPAAPGTLSISLATTYRSVGGGVSKIIASIAPCSGLRATVVGTLIATVTLNADGTYGVT